MVRTRAYEAAAEVLNEKHSRYRLPSAIDAGTVTRVMELDEPPTDDPMICP